MGATTSNIEKLNFNEVWLMFQDTDKKLNQLERLFTGQWGKLIESLVEGDLVKILNEKGIDVVTTSTRTKRFFNNRQYEFDIIAENGDDIVIVEVKTTLKPNDIKEFLSELKVIKTVLPKYQHNKIMGAVAYLTDEGEAAVMAEKKGLFVIRATGISASITNSADFKPKIW